MDKRFQYVIIGVHRSIREIVGWAGKEGFVPLTSERQMGQTTAPQLKVIDGDTAEELMSHLTKRSTTTKYEFALVPVVTGTTAPNEGRTESGIILPH